MKTITTPLSLNVVKGLRIGDTVSLSGKVYTARDAAHMKLNELIKKGKSLPFDMKGAVVYYVGPTPTPPKIVIGSAGPTSSYRMDALTSVLLRKGLKGMIGKGERSPETIKEIKKYGAVYFAAIGGAGALIAKKIKSSKVIAFPELGAEAIRELVVEDFPLIVANDSYGGDIFEEGKKKYKKH